MEDYIISLILEALARALAKAVEDGVKYVIKKAVDSAGNVITKIVYEYDSDGDGIMDGEETIFTLDTMIPNLDNGYCLCNKGNEIGLGYPSFRLVDANEVLPIIQDTDFIGDGDFIVTDLDGDGNDDVLLPVPYDGDGDGLPDFQIVVDDDDNGLPDVSPYSPFYPVGSEEYTTIVERTSPESRIMETPLDDYNVSEGLLLIIVILLGFNFVRGLFTRKDVFR